MGARAQVTARYVHFVALHAWPDSLQHSTMLSLLGTDDCRSGGPDNAVQGAGERILRRLVVPRPGTISPWSTKATEIFRLCGLDPVIRVERGVMWEFSRYGSGFDASEADLLAAAVFDPMIESVLDDEDEVECLFRVAPPARLEIIDLAAGGACALERAGSRLGFSLDGPEQEYLLGQFRRLGRNPTDVELMMFAQVNSEHCRHKIFNADWCIDGCRREHSLFSMIRHTHRAHPSGTLRAYADNAAIIRGPTISRFSPDAVTRRYCYVQEPVHILIKVETHNHPTAISPFPGAATGSGGEIRDEGATGRGGRPGAGLVGYSVSHLRLPDLPRPWECRESRPRRIASPLQIMIEAPLGAAAFNNEFGRPCIAGYFRDFEMETDSSGPRLGYHKPIMLAGGVGSIRAMHVDKAALPEGSPIVVLGGPAMLIGMGGGAASSVVSGSQSEDLDFASVQRGNPEMQRRCQEVIDACCGLGEGNPILSIHDVGAGGLCNALPELVEGAGSGGRFELRKVPSDDSSMSPLEIWCNESQERYVLAVDPDRLDTFRALCRRERCLYAVIGQVTAEQRLSLSDSLFEADPDPVDLPMEVLFGLPPKMNRNVASVESTLDRMTLDGLAVDEALDRVLSHPTVSDKTFLVTIGDRSVTGLIARDQMVGPWQVPVADVGVVASAYTGNAGVALGIGERTPIAAIDAPASARMAIGEAITNLAAADIGSMGQIRLSANWMVAAGEPGIDADLYEAVRSVTHDVCPELGISIPVGKDSMSMRMTWESRGKEQGVVSPLSLVVSGFSPVQDIRNTLTPQLRCLDKETVLLLADLGQPTCRLGASILAQVYNRPGGEVPDLDEPSGLRCLFRFIQSMIRDDLVLAYHDRSDGGLIAAVCEMMFAARCGVFLDIPDTGEDPLGFLFNEELGAVLQVERDMMPAVRGLAETCGIACLEIGFPVASDILEIRQGGQVVLSRERESLHQVWSATTWQIQRMRDNPSCADQEYMRIRDRGDTGLHCRLPFEHDATELRQNGAPGLNLGRPRMAILREQGVNGQLEMAAAFHGVGFEALDVTTTDLLGGRRLDDFCGLAACGGFSFGDVLGAGAGWGKSILYNSMLKDLFEEFFNRPDTFSLGICNGCQMLSSIREIIPGAGHWPDFIRNLSEQYEARFVMTEICSDRSVFLSGMQGARIPVSTAHGEGRVEFREPGDLAALQENGQVCLRFVDSSGEPTERYPLNPNGSAGGVTGFASSDGRVTIMMPHPERVLRTVSNSWHPGGWGEYGPWIRMFRNAREWVG